MYFREELDDVGPRDGDQTKSHVDVQEGQAGCPGLHADAGEIDAVEAAGPAVEDGVFGEGPGYGVVEDTGVAVEEAGGG